MPNYKVEIGFEKLTEYGSFFTLDDAIKGQLGNVTYTLSGGGFWVDVSNYVRSVSTNRGKSRQLDKYTAGQAQITFTNYDRAFDPTFTSSPFFGEIVPRRKVRVSVNGVYIFNGIIEDWNLSYNATGESIAEANAVDAFTVLAKLTLVNEGNDIELSGTRIQKVLSDPGVQWPVQDRDISSGKTVLGDDVIPEDTNALTYLDLVAQSEPGNLFIDSEGNLAFKDRNNIANLKDITLADDGTGISYNNLMVTYGSELLYNEVIVSSAITNNASTAVSIPSQESYGISSYQANGLLINSDSDLDEYANYLLKEFKDPEFRFEGIDIELRKHSQETQASILDLEMGDVIKIKFTPNNIPPAIEEYVQVIKIDHDISLDSHIVRIGFASVAYFDFVLDSSAFGRLDVNTLAW